jgi:hypothetical protein
MEIECDHSCSWEAALELAGDQKDFCGFFVPSKNHLQIFLALPLDEWRVRVCLPQKLYGGEISNRWVARNCFKAAPAQMAQVKVLWERVRENAVKRELHLERFALLNGSVFSAWHNVREARRASSNPFGPALRPAALTVPTRVQHCCRPSTRISTRTPRQLARSTRCRTAAGAGASGATAASSRTSRSSCSRRATGRSSAGSASRHCGRRRAKPPLDSIDLVMAHLRRTALQVHAAQGGRNCNKRYWGSGALCRKKACLGPHETQTLLLLRSRTALAPALISLLLAVDGYSEVDKLKKSIELHTRTLAGTEEAGGAGVLAAMEW